MTRQELIDIGFKEIPHFTIGNTLIYDLDRRRHLSVADLGGPNEFMYLCEVDDENSKEINDLVCVHNYDYDGKLSMEKVKGLISCITARIF